MGTWQANFTKRWNDRAGVSIDLGGTTGQFSITVLFGKSGEGKTTALRCLAGLERPDDGRIEFDGDCWFSNRDHKSPQQRGIGFLLQDRALFPHLTVAENVAFGIPNTNRQERERRTLDLLRRWGIDSLRARYPRQLSGGEQQRTALARSLAAEPRLLLLDEPLSSLDEPTRERLGSELRTQLQAYDIPVLLVTHRRDEALALGDRICMIHSGKTVQTGDIQDVFNRPLNAEVADILGWTLFPEAQIVESSNNAVTIGWGENKVAILGQAPIGSSARWGIRSHDVTLELTDEHRSAEYNSIHALITGIRPDERGLRVEVDIGSRIEVIVPRDHPTSSLAVGKTVRIAFSRDAARLF